MRRRYSADTTLTPEEGKRVLYWLKNSELSTWQIAKKLSVDESEVRRVRDVNGLQGRYVFRNKEKHENSNN